MKGGLEESLISSREDAALWCEIVWSCHLSQASLKATLKPVMGLTSSSSNSFMSLFIFCFVTPSSPQFLPDTSFSLACGPRPPSSFPFLALISFTFQQAAGNILITLLFISLLWVQNNARDPPEMTARYESFAGGMRALIFPTI